MMDTKWIPFGYQKWIPLYLEVPSNQTILITGFE
jgi:hypothetical protein